MTTITQSHQLFAASLVGLVLVAGIGGPASARQDPGEPIPDKYAHLTPGRYPLLRVDRQLSRGDYLTGAGVAAPLTVPEA